MNTESKKPSKYIIALIIIVVILVLAAIAGKGKWVLFYDTSIAGSVVDAETGKPLEKVIVVGLWQLSQTMGQGFGGYSKVILVETDKEGKFKLPWWVTFKPSTFWLTTRDGAPQVIIYKPGYKLMYTGRDAWKNYDKVPYMSNAEIALAKKQQQGFGINPTGLKKISTDKERIENYDDFKLWANFPSPYYSAAKTRIIVVALTEEMIDLSDSNEDKQHILNRINKLR